MSFQGDDEVLMLVYNVQLWTTTTEIILSIIKNYPKLKTLLLQCDWIVWKKNIVKGGGKVNGSLPLGNGYPPFFDCFKVESH